MTKSQVSTFLRGLRSSVSKHSPEILTGLGIAGMITTTVLAVKATPKAMKACEERKVEQGGELSKLDCVKAAWKYYIPAAVTGVTSAACLIGANSVNAKRNAALATAYKISETAFIEYKDKVVETIGDKKEQTIRDKVAEDRVKRNPVSSNEVFITSKGNTLFYDSLSGRYFETDIEYVKKVVNEINRRLLNEMYISLNEFYTELGLHETRMGDELGWNIDDGMLDIHFSPQMSDDGRPCLAIDYSIAPKYDYSKMC